MDSANGLPPQGQDTYEQALQFFLTWGWDGDPAHAQEHAMLVAAGEAWPDWADQLPGPAPAQPGRTDRAQS